MENEATKAEQESENATIEDFALVNRQNYFDSGLISLFAAIRNRTAIEKELERFWEELARVTPIGGTQTLAEPIRHEKLAHLSRCYAKYGHRFARKKRQMKKNRKRYGICWKIGRIARIISRPAIDSKGQVAEWAFLGNNGELWNVNHTCPETISLSQIVKVANAQMSMPPRITYPPTPASAPTSS